MSWAFGACFRICICFKKELITVTFASEAILIPVSTFSLIVLILSG